MSDELDREVLAWRAGRIAGLTGPEGWLSLVGLVWLDRGAHRVGSDPAGEVVLPSGASPPFAGILRVAPSAVTFEAAPGSGVTHLGGPVGTIELRDDAKGDPTVLEVGSVRFHLIRRTGRLAVRIRDTESPARRAFRGIESYPIDPAWRFEARFEAYEQPRQSRVPTVVGLEETYETPGALAFEVGATTHRLVAFLEPGETDLFIVFGDLTNGTETYGGGRYLSTRPPDDRGSVVLDFNRAYNPPCVFTPYATCALPLPQNRLPLRVEAGERRYSGKAPTSERLPSV